MRSTTFQPRPIVLLKALPGLLVLLLGWIPVQAEEPARIMVAGDKGRVSVDANAPLLRILEEVGQVTGVPIILETGLETQLAAEERTVSFAGLSLQEALEQLLPGRNVMLVHSTEGLAEVRVYTTGKRQPARPQVRVEGANEARGLSGADVPPDTAAEAARLRKEALSDPDPDRRASALAELAASGDDKLALETTVEVLERERDATVLESALNSIDSDSFPLEPLLKLLGSDREASLRLRALELLSDRDPQDSRLRAVLRRLARTERNEDLRETARRLLENLDAE